MSRLDRLYTALQEYGFAALLLMPDANLRYLTGLSFHKGKRLTLAVFPTDGGMPRLVVPALDYEAAKAKASIPMQFYGWSDAAGPMAALRRCLHDTFGTTAPTQPVAVEYTALRLMELRAVEAVLPAIQTADAGPLFAALRMVKDADELAAMERAAQVIDTSLEQLIPQIRVGMSERQVAALWSEAIIAAGGEGESFNLMVGSGPNSANPHHETSNRSLQLGDLVILDGGALIGGYASDITRTIALGQPSDAARQIYALVQAANAAGKAVVRPGVSGEMIDHAARQVIAAAGYGDYFVHRTGHGLGLEVHELPNIVAGSSEPLAIGTTFTIEPGIYLPGVGGVRIEDDMVVTADGGRSLTNFPRDLIMEGLPLGAETHEL